MTDRTSVNRVLVMRTRRDDGVYCEAAPLGLVWVVSGSMLWADAFEMRPLTIRHLVWYLVRNQAVWAYWRSWMLLHRAGFLSTREGERFSWRHFRVPPWAWRGKGQ